MISLFKKTIAMLESISSTFYARVLCGSKLSSFSLVTFGFVIFWCKNIGSKSTRKMLMKLTPACQHMLFS